MQLYSWNLCIKITKRQMKNQKDKTDTERTLKIQSENLKW